MRQSRWQTLWPAASPTMLFWTHKLLLLLHLSCWWFPNERLADVSRMEMQKHELFYLHAYTFMQPKILTKQQKYALFISRFLPGGFILSHPVGTCCSEAKYFVSTVIRNEQGIMFAINTRPSLTMDQRCRHKHNTWQRTTTGNGSSYQ